jgi:hypothetical protein
MKKILLSTVTFMTLGTGVVAEENDKMWVSSMSEKTSNETISFSPEISSLGYGAEVNVQINDKLSVGLGGNMFDYDTTETIDGIDYDIDVGFETFGPHFQYQPLGKGLMLFGGVRVNNNEIDLLTNPTVDITIGNQTYTATDVVEVRGKVDFNDYSPLVGVGYQKMLGDNLSLSGKLGVLYHGTPEVTVNASGPLSNDSTFLTELERERQNIENDISSQKYYPVVSLGVDWRF